MTSKRLDIAIGLMSILGTAALMLTACTEMYEPSHLTPKRLQVVENKFFVQAPIGSVNENFIGAAADEYRSTARGPLDLTVTYDPQSKSNTARKANQKLSALSEAFVRSGVKQVNGGVLPVYSQGETSQVMISYAAYEARPPEGCKPMTGLVDTKVDPDRDYPIGCTYEAAIARQVRPKDLAGRGSDDPYSEGRRAANVVDRYRTGAPNEPLEGESASD